MREISEDHPDDGRSRRIERIAQEMARVRGFRHEHWDHAIEEDVDFFEVYADFTNAFWDPQFERRLDRKTHALITMVLFASEGVEATLPAHIRRALRLGVTRREILEAFEAAVIPAGAPTLYRGIKALMQVASDDAPADTPRADASGDAE